MVLGNVRRQAPATDSLRRRQNCASPSLTRLLLQQSVIAESHFLRLLRLLRALLVLLCYGVIDRVANREAPGLDIVNHNLVTVNVLVVVWR